jgi:integrase/recombinase XerD
MLANLFSRASKKYLSLPLFGPVMNDFSDWLEQQGYTYYSRRYYVWIVACMDEQLRRRRVKRLQDLSPLALHDCLKAQQRRSSMAAHVGFAQLLERFLTSLGLLKISPRRVSSPTEIQLRSYSEYLRDVRGFSPSTVRGHLRTASRFLTHLGFDAGRRRLLGLEASDLESFLRMISKSQSRGTLQHTVAELRGFLRFLVTTGKVKPGLESQIDTPRLYR